MLPLTNNALQSSSCTRAYLITVGRCTCNRTDVQQTGLTRNKRRIIADNRCRGWNTSTVRRATSFLLNRFCDERKSAAVVFIHVSARETLQPPGVTAVGLVESAVSHLDIPSDSCLTFLVGRPRHPTPTRRRSSLQVAHAPTHGSVKLDDVERRQ
jgi:hypothetical protein